MTTKNALTAGDAMPLPPPDSPLLTYPATPNETIKTLQEKHP
jgi:hypothetical protein